MFVDSCPSPVDVVAVTAPERVVKVVVEALVLLWFQLHLKGEKTGHMLLMQNSTTKSHDGGKGGLLCNCDGIAFICNWLDLSHW